MRSIATSHAGMKKGMLRSYDVCQLSSLCQDSFRVFKRFELRQFALFSRGC
eukprot:m.275996 g.275996  ORF g.275996 m.275996 type:complete len:51 (-) comp54858_c0_seq3:141-293(-)